MQMDYLLAIYFASKREGGRIITDDYYKLLYVPMTNREQLQASISNQNYNAITWWIGDYLRAR
jgi:hypothetical protein